MELGNLLFGHSRGDFEVPRYKGYEEEIQRLFTAADIDWDGTGDDGDTITDTFEVRPYDWGRCDCEGNHKDDCLVVRPNFKHYKSGLELRWYKYPLRDSYFNQECSLSRFREIINDCIGSLSETERGAGGFGSSGK